jgi:hypothetical protein
MKKIFKILGLIVGIIAMIVIMFFEVAAFDGYIDSKVDRVQAAIQEQKTISKDSIMKASLPLIFSDQSLDLVGGKLPTDFPAYHNPTTDCGITGTPAEFAKYFEKCFKDSKADQVIITAVDMNDGKLRWHIKVHEKK